MTLDCSKVLLNHSATAGVNFLDIAPKRTSVISDIRKRFDMKETVPQDAKVTVPLAEVRIADARIVDARMAYAQMVADQELLVERRAGLVLTSFVG